MRVLPPAPNKKVVFVLWFLSFDVLHRLNHRWQHIKVQITKTKDLPLWKVARGGAQLVLKTRPGNTSRGFDSFTFRPRCQNGPRNRTGSFRRRRLMVWQSRLSGLNRRAMRVQVQLLPPPPKVGTACGSGRASFPAASPNGLVVRQSFGGESE